MSRRKRTRRDKREPIPTRPERGFFIESPMNAKAITIEPLVYTKAQLPAVIGLGKSAIDNMRRKGQFPHPRKLGGKKVGWPVEELKEWLKNRPLSTGLND